ncbi:MAG: alpha/beta hydrolase [Acidobacteria bacterium]|nr:alpha/beta hydrolase [Acidobacteriota bacterium]
MKRKATWKTWIGGTLGLALLGTVGFTGWKTRSVAHELVDPPFYHPVPLARVEATYADLAKGNGADPGGTWSSEPFDGLQLWRLHRAKPAPGVVLLLHGFGDDRWGTSPALRWFPGLDAEIFTYLDRDDALREGRAVPPITFGVQESEEVVAVVHRLESEGTPRNRILIMGRSLGASVGLLALEKLEAEGKGPLAGLIWEGPPISSRDFAERLVRGPEDRRWHFLAPPIGSMASAWAGCMGHYDPGQTKVLNRLDGRMLKTPALLFLATQDRLSPPLMQSRIADHFETIRVVAAPTWHLHCSEVLGADYAKDIHAFTEETFPTK